MSQQVNTKFSEEEIDVIDSMAAYLVETGRLEKATRTDVIRAAIRVLANSVLQEIEARRGQVQAGSSVPVQQPETSTTENSSTEG